MKINYHIILLIITFFLSSFCINEDYNATIIKKFKIESDELLAVIFVDYGSCIKCIVLPENILDHVKDSIDKKIKIVAFVYCDRIKEIDNFKKDFNWKYYIEPDIKGTSRKKFGCSEDCILCLLNSSGKILIQIDNNYDPDIIHREIIDSVQKNE